LAHLIKDLFFKSRNLHIELDKPSAFHTLNKMYFFWNQWKNKHYPKHVLFYFYQMVIKNLQIFPKHFIIKAPCYVLLNFQFMQCIFPYFQSQISCK
jgi:hypothetical protein